MQEESAIELSKQSKERALVSEVISTVALADQISREFKVSNQGIDMEIEFTDDAHEATSRKLYLQLKSGDSYLRERKRDNGKKQVKQLVFEGERFDVLGVRRWRERVLWPA